MVILSSQANDRQLNCLIRIFRLVSIGEVPLYRHTYNLLKVYKKLTKFNSDFWCASKLPSTFEIAPQ